MLSATLVWAGEPNAPEPASGNTQKRGQEIIRKFVEVNRYWLVGPPASVQNFSYVLQRLGGNQEFDITNPRKTPRPRLQGVTYSTLVHQLARAPRSATVTEIVEEKGRVRLALKFDPAIRCAIGNGVENSWNGYHSFGGSDGYVVLDTERWVPLEAHIGRLTETFGEYTRVDDQHYVPLAILEDLGDTQYDWRFRLYAPGLWLFDDSTSGGRRWAWVESVKVNSAPAQLVKATQASLDREEHAKVGRDRLEAFLQANRNWLLPSLEARRGLVYEYRQEAPYLERVMFDPDGNIMSRLEATKDSPDKPTLQRLWLADGRYYSGDVSDQFVKLEGEAGGAAQARSWIQRDRIVQHVAMGLALDCAVTRLAREPENFWAEQRPEPNAPDRYLLVLHARHDARLFTGTMLTFSSWCFMHDVDYDRSEILCDAATHQPLEERDYAGKQELKGEYRFEEWLSDASGSYPGRIRAMLPNERKGKDESLEMEARFRFARPGVWLLERVESSFRGGGGGSTGTVSVVAANAESFQPIRDLLQKAAATSEVLETVEHAPVGSTVRAIQPGEWSPLPLQAAWTDQARDSARSREERREGRPLQKVPIIGVHRARVVTAADGSAQLELEGLSTASWKEFRTEWRIKIEDATARVLSTVTTNVDLKAEGGPTPFQIRLSMPPPAVSPTDPPRQIAVEATVQRMTGMYHGHGMWFRITEKE